MLKFMNFLIGLASLVFCSATGFAQGNVQFPFPNISGNISAGNDLPGVFPFYSPIPSYQTIGKISYATSPSCTLSAVTLKYGKKKADGTNSLFTSAGNYPSVFNASFGNNASESNANILVFDYSHPNSVGFNFGAYPIQTGENYAVEVELTLIVPVTGSMIPATVKTSKFFNK